MLDDELHPVYMNAEAAASLYGINRENQAKEGSNLEAIVEDSEGLRYDLLKLKNGEIDNFSCRLFLKG